MKRPMLVSGITAILVLALLIFFESGAVVVPVITALVLFFCILKRKRIKEFIIVPTICIASLLTVISFFCYNNTKVTPYLKYDKTYEDLSGKIITTPRYVSNYIMFTLQADKIGTNATDTKIHVVLSNDFETKIDLYDYIVLPDAYITISRDDYGNYDLTQLSDNTLLTAESYSFEALWACDKTPYYYCLRFKEIVSLRINQYMTQNNGALLKGMLFGEKADLDYTTSQDFRNCGISHLLAVSGLHTSLWCGLLISILSIFKIPEKVRNIICLVFLVLFCIISAFTPSVVRASIMTAVTLIAPFFKRTPDSINSLGAAVTFLILANPYTVLNISFQLSASATLGVLMAGTFNSKIQNLSRKISVKKLRNTTATLLTSLLISFMAGLFTMPVSVYYFEVFSLAAPASNLLCVQLAFYGMISGIISVALSFINLPFINEICLFLFKITEFILDLVKELAGFVSQFRYCTIPVHREYLHIGLIVALIIFCGGYIIYKFRKSTQVLKLTALLGAICCSVSIIIPLTLPSHRNTITIANCENGIQLIIRSGIRYAYIENTSSEIFDGTFNALPKATCESLEYYFPTYLSETSINNISTIDLQYTPLETIIPPSVRATAQSNDITIPENVEISSSGFFTLSDEITLEIVDTTSIKYAIIRGKEKNAFIHLYGDTDFSKYLSAEDCDIAVYNGTLPSQIPENAETVIISADNYNPIEADRLASRCSDFYITAKHGSVKINL